MRERNIRAAAPLVTDRDWVPGKAASHSKQRYCDDCIAWRSIFAQESRSVTMRLITGASAV